MAPLVPPLASCCTVQPVLTVGMARRVGRSQSNGVTTFDDGITDALKGKQKNTVSAKVFLSSYLN